MDRTFRYRLSPTGNQRALLAEMLRDHCRLYNAALQERRDAWRMCRVSVTYAMQGAQLPDIRAADPEADGKLVRAKAPKASMAAAS